MKQLESYEPGFNAISLLADPGEMCSKSYIRQRFTWLLPIESIIPIALLQIKPSSTNLPDLIAKVAASTVFCCFKYI
jgi:hypothetical protein